MRTFAGEPHGEAPPSASWLPGSTTTRTPPRRERRGRVLGRRAGVTRSAPRSWAERAAGRRPRQGGTLRPVGDRRRAIPRTLVRSRIERVRAAVGAVMIAVRRRPRPKRPCTVTASPLLTRSTRSPRLPVSTSAWPPESTMTRCRKTSTIRPLISASDPSVKAGTSSGARAVIAIRHGPSANVAAPAPAAAAATAATTASRAARRCPFPIHRPCRSPLFGKTAWPTTTERPLDGPVQDGSRSPARTPCGPMPSPGGDLLPGRVATTRRPGDSAPGRNSPP